ncbi:hypothetical protein [Streptomyces sp. NPDC092952]|uniref:hypothetical protein n=1 Tax=Streptomyces sp. NPDC092952 TaxID=3366018 RepID=UPI00381991FD
MPQPEAHPEVVALLWDTNARHLHDTDVWTHRDGRPFAEEEMTLISRVTRADFKELKAQQARYLEYIRECEEAPETIQIFLAPFMEQLDEKNLGNAHELMTEDERAEFNRLLGLMIGPVRPFTPYAF